jgi:hypothetical protein
MLAMNIKGTTEDKMSRHNLLVTCAVVAFAAATGASMAQERGPQQERGAPAEKIAPQNTPGAHNQGPNGRTGEAPQNRSRSETTGQAPREDRQGRPTERNSEPERGKTEQPSRSERNEQNRAAPQEQNRTTGQAPREEQNRTSPREQNRTTGQAPREEQNRTSPREQNRTTGQAPREDRTNRSSEQNRLEQERGRTDRTEENRATTGQGAAGSRSGATVNLTPEKRTRIHEVIVKERNAPRVSSPDFNVSVGTRVPRTVRFAALPRTIVEIEPEWRGFEYFMVADQIIVVDPKTMEIVAVLDA